MNKEVGFAIWFTGLPASGKTTLAEGLTRRLRDRDRTVQLLDSDELRHVLTPQPTYTRKERDWFYQALAFIAKLLTQNGVNVLIAATAARRQFREHARREIECFAEVYVQCSLETCMERDKKGIYEKAIKGQATTVPGLQVPDEAPLHPTVVVDTERVSPAKGVRQVLARLEKLSFLRG